MPYSRRELGRLAFSLVPAMRVARTAPLTNHSQTAMPHIRWAGVDVGAAVATRDGLLQATPDELLEAAVTLGITTVELDANRLEAFLGAPPEPALLHPPDDGFDTGLLPEEEEVFRDELEISRATFDAQVRQWRASVSLGPIDELRERYDETGVRVAVLRWDDLASWADAEVDYAFRLAHAIGASLLSTELTTAAPGRLGPAANRHGLVVSFRGQEGTHPDGLSAALGHGGLTGVSLDLGTWTAGGHGSPLPFLTSYANRITHVYLTDRRASDGTPVPLGQGDAPIRDVLQAMRDRQWPFPALIDVTADTAGESDPLDALARAVAYCREILGN